MEKARKLDEALFLSMNLRKSPEVGTGFQNRQIDNKRVPQASASLEERKSRLLLCAPRTTFANSTQPCSGRKVRLHHPCGGLIVMVAAHILQHYLSKTNHGEVDLDKILPANSFLHTGRHRVSFPEGHSARVREGNVVGKDYRISTRTFLEIIPKSAHLD